MRLGARSVRDESFATFGQTTLNGIFKLSKEKFQRIQILKIRIVDVRTDGQLNLVESSYGPEAPRGYKNRVCGFQSQNITNNIKDILLKLNKNEPISFKYVDKWNGRSGGSWRSVPRRLNNGALSSMQKQTQKRLKSGFKIIS